MQKSRKTESSNLLDIHLAGDAADGAHAPGADLRRKFRLRAAPRAWRSDGQRFVQGMAMARPGEGRRFVLCFQPFCHQRGQRVQQSRQAFAAFQRQRKAVAFLKSGQIAFIPDHQIGCDVVGMSVSDRCRPAAAR